MTYLVKLPMVPNMPKPRERSDRTNSTAAAVKRGTLKDIISCSKSSVALMTPPMSRPVSCFVKKETRMSVKQRTPATNISMAETAGQQTEGRNSKAMDPARGDDARGSSSEGSSYTLSGDAPKQLHRSSEPTLDTG